MNSLAALKLCIFHFLNSLATSSAMLLTLSMKSFAADRLSKRADVVPGFHRTSTGNQMLFALIKQPVSHRFYFVCIIEGGHMRLAVSSV